MSAAIIPARGGSTRIPRKNIREFQGRPMLAWAIGAAQESGVFARIYVSTEDAEIANVAHQCGVSVIPRPAHLAANEVGTQEVMQHAVYAASIRPEAEVCCIYPCVPLLLPTDLRQARKQLFQSAGLWPYVIAVGAKPLRDIGWFYYGHAHNFMHAMPLIGPETSPYVVDEARAIDINTFDDLARAEAAFAAQQRRAA